MATLAGIGPGQEDARRVHTNLVLSLRAPDRECLSVVANFPPPFHSGVATSYPWLFRPDESSPKACPISLLIEYTDILSLICH